MSQDKIFADGFIFKRRENAPDFVIGNISVKVDNAIGFYSSFVHKDTAIPLYNYVKFDYVQYNI